MKLALRLIVFLGVFSAAPAAWSQTAQATLAGEVRNQQGAPMAGVRVFARNVDTGAVNSALTNAEGQYVVPLLPRGRYVVAVQAIGYRPLERRDVELHVAQRASADFRLEPLTPDAAASLGALEPEAATRGGVALIYGPDAQAQLGVVDDRPPPMTDATSSTVSSVIEERRITDLPLGGRDVYTLFVLLPGVTSDNATQRGLGFSVNGFRPSSSNYLLDGVDNNYVQSTFVGTLLSPDAIEEYRLSTNNFSAEYGRGAFVANVVTRAGGNRWHGTLFDFLMNEKLNANGFQENANGRPRAPFKQHQFGYSLGGPLVRNRLFVSTSLEAFRASTVAAATNVLLPAPGFASRATGPIARDLLNRFPALPLENPVVEDANRIRGVIHPHIPIATLAASGRLDWEMRPDRDRLFFRFGSFDQRFDNFTFSPYRGLEVPFITAARNVAVGHTHRFTPSVVMEAKFGFNRNENDYTPRVPGIPELISRDQTRLPGNVGSSAEQAYSDDLYHASGTLSAMRSRHHIVTGGEFRPVAGSSRFAPGRIGRFTFLDLAGFAADQPSGLDTTVDRFAAQWRSPEYRRSYRQNDFAGFIQDTWRVSPRLTLNLGVRYEYFGVPRTAPASEEINFYFGPGSTLEERTASGGLRRTSENPGNLRGLLYKGDRNNFAPRFGFAFDVFGNSRTVLRGGFGIYYDRLFNLLWDAVRQNNMVQVFFNNASGFRYASPASEALPSGASAVPRGRAYAIDAGIRTPYVQTWFLGVQHAPARNLLVEVTQSGVLGRRLPVRDVWNRGGLANQSVLEVQGVSTMARSSYLGLQSSVQKRFSRGFQFQVSHTWSHAIDSQGDPLIVPQFAEVGFERQADSTGDRGNSDFDQRHNLVFNALWQAPRATGRGWAAALRSGWQVAAIAGYRTGFPFTVIARPRGFVQGEGVLLRPRADYLGGEALFDPGAPAKGGLVLLDRARFADPFLKNRGNLGRNALRGPGFWNYDLSLSREFGLARVTETARLQFRAEFFNLFNHANLANPDTRLDSPFFGLAQFGRRGFEGLAVGSSPLNEFARRIQLALRLTF